jgi:peptide/nickel transport system ATP-binding protein
LSDVLTVTNLSVDYRTSGVVHALSDVSFGIRQGEILGVVGESGSGKSTLALAVSRLLTSPPAFYKSGQILFGDTDMLNARQSDIDSLRGTGMFMVFQDPLLSLNPLMKIRDQIIEGIAVRTKRKGETFVRPKAEEEVNEHLTSVRIGDASDVASRYPHQLSGGQNQRIMLAIALAEKPKLLIADEPTTALDVTSQAQVLNVLKGIVAGGKMAMMYITHDLVVAGSFCDRIAVMYGGMIQEIGPAEQVMRNPKHPYSSGLITSLPSKRKVDGPLAGISGTFRWDEIGGMCAFAPRCPLVHDECKKGVPSLVNVDTEQVRCVNYGAKHD